MQHFPICYNIWMSYFLPSKINGEIAGSLLFSDIRRLIEVYCS